MASLPTCAPASHSIGPVRRPSAAGAHLPLRAFITPAAHNLHARQNLRLNQEVRVQVKKNRFSPIFASNVNSSERSGDSKTSKDAPGPPFLTILAGLLVFLFLCWVIGSVVTWLIGLIVHPPALK